MTTFGVFLRGFGALEGDEVEPIEDFSLHPFTAIACIDDNDKKATFNITVRLQEILMNTIGATC